MDGGYRLNPRSVRDDLECFCYVLAIVFVLADSINVSIIAGLLHLLEFVFSLPPPHGLLLSYHQLKNHDWYYSKRTTRSWYDLEPSVALHGLYRPGC